MSRPMNKACCERPPVEADYKPQGTMQRIGEFNCYVIGPQDAKRVILGVYDVFGLWPSTQQGADLLSSMTGARVVMPDLFQGKPLPIDTIPADTTEKQALLQQFINSHAMEARKNDIVSVAHALQAQGVQTLGIYALCWGAKVGLLACGQGSPFKAFAQVHPTFVQPQDAKQLTVPVATFRSGEEPEDVMRSFHETALSNEVIATNSVFGEYHDLHHGFAGARADLGNEANKIAFQDVYKRLAEFFTQTMP